MVVAASNYISNTLQAVDDTIANCATFRAVMGAGSVAACQALSKWQDYRTAETAPFYRLVFTGGTDVEQGIRTQRHSVEVEFYACWPVATLAVAQDTERDKTMRATNAWGAILSELASLIGTSTSAYIMKAIRQYQAPQLTPDDTDHPDCWDATIVFNVEI